MDSIEPTLELFCKEEEAEVFIPCLLALTGWNYSR